MVYFPKSLLSINALPRSLRDGFVCPSRLSVPSLPLAQFPRLDRACTKCRDSLRVWKEAEIINLFTQKI
jgi:hypothetical protein